MEELSDEEFEELFTGSWWNFIKAWVKAMWYGAGKRNY